MRIKFKHYTYDEVKDILDSKKRGVTIEEIALSTTRSIAGLKGLLFLYKKFQKNPKYVWNFSKNTASLFEKYDQGTPAEIIPTGGEKEENPKIDFLVGQIDETFTQLKVLMGQLIEVAANQKAQEAIEEVKAEAKSRTKELNELREFKDNVEKGSFKNFLLGKIQKIT